MTITRAKNDTALTCRGYPCFLKIAGSGFDIPETPLTAMEENIKIKRTML